MTQNGTKIEEIKMTIPIKYPKTYHFEWSENLQNDDRRLEHDRDLQGQEVVVSLKMDGENTSFYRDYIHARSLSSADHPSRHVIKALHAQIKHLIPEGWRVCGENMCAFHSIYYDRLESYFYVFAVFNEKNECLSWSEIEEWAKLLELKTVPVIYRGQYDVNKIQNAYANNSSLKGWSPHPTKTLFDVLTCHYSAIKNKPISDYMTYRKLLESNYLISDYSVPAQEGYVCRVAKPFHFNDFSTHVAKYVRKNHVQTTEFWMTLPVIPNKLKS